MLLLLGASMVESEPGITTQGFGTSRQASALAPNPLLFHRGVVAYVGDLTGEVGHAVADRLQGNRMVKIGRLR